MRAFIDTSTLLKKYKSERGSEDFEKLRKEISEIIVSPITYIEIMNAVHRYCEKYQIKKLEYEKIKESIDQDFAYFRKVPMDHDLEEIAVVLRKNNIMKSLDLIQFAAAQRSRADVILTSDKTLFNIAKKSKQKVLFI